MVYVEVIWDLEDDPDGNVRHIMDRHGVTRDEVEEILRDPNGETTESRSTGEQITFGWTSAGRYLAVVWEEAWDDPRQVYPITAYPVDPPRGKRHGKRTQR